MASNSDKNFVLVKDKIPLVGKGVEALIVQLHTVLSENKLAQKVILDVQRPFIYLEKMVSLEEASEAAPTISMHDAIRASRMLEFIPAEKSDSPLMQIFEIFNRMAKDGLEVSHVVVGSPNSLVEWITLPRTATSLFGVPIITLKELPEDVAIFCGSRSKDAAAEEIQFCMKIVMEKQ